MWSRLLCWLGFHVEPESGPVFRDEYDNTFVASERVVKHIVAYTCARCGENVWKEWETDE